MKINILRSQSKNKRPQGPKGPKLFWTLGPLGPCGPFRPLILILIPVFSILMPLNLSPGKYMSSSSNSSAPLEIILLGPPGSGKGTQAKRLTKEYHLPHISSGDLFREHMASGTSIGQKAKSFIQAGQLVPDEVVLHMIFDRIAQPDCKKGYLLDGFPRTALQAEELAKHPSMQSTLLVFSLQVDDEVIIHRAAGRLLCRDCGHVYNRETLPPAQNGVCDKCGGEVYRRSDDDPEVVRKRLAVYHNQTELLLKYYAEKKLLTVFDGNRTPDAVYADLKRTIDAHTQERSK